MSTPSTILIEDYKELPYLIPETNLTVYLHPSQTRVINCMTIEPSPHWDNQPLRLNGEQITFGSISCEVDSIEWKLVNDELIISPFSNRRTITVETIISPITNTELDGLYFVKDTYCTQNEPEGFRKITYFYDRPDNMSRFTTTVIADKGQFPYLLSNGNPVASTELDNNRHSVTWVDPFPKPSYLFALVAGNFDVIEDQFTTMSGRNILLQIYSDRGVGDRCHYAMESLKRAMAWDEQQYGREYDLDRFMIVAIDSFNMGAMENKGLNIFNSAYILADPKTATDADYMNIEGVVAHEYFHNWTGNRITCRNWFQLTLKEGLTVYRDQEFSSDMNSRGIKRIADVRTLKEAQFTEDAGPMAHPIQPKSYIEINNFYTSTVYNKGAEIIRMMALIAGTTGYRRGTDIYFDRYDGQAVTTEDFVTSIEEGASIDLTQFRRWYHQAGTPHVTVTPIYEGPRLRGLTFDQTCRDTPETTKKLPFVIPISLQFYTPSGAACVVTIDSGEPSTQPIVILTTTTQSISISTESEIFSTSIFQNLSAPVTYDYPYSTEQLAHLLSYDCDPVNRFDSSQKLYESLLISDGDMTVSPSLDNAIARLIADPSIDPALAAACLQFPTLNRLLELTPTFDIERLTDNRRKLFQWVAQKFHTLIHDRYLLLHPVDDYKPTAEQIGNRRLRNTLLSLLSELSPDTAWIQFQTASNMTDQLAALSALLNTPAESDKSLEAVERYFAQWQHEPLVVNKWFTVQASSSHGSTPARVEVLRNHPKFDRLIPNQFRALVGSFAQNLPHFHCPSGRGYQWVGQQIRDLDPHNPQIAARVALAFQRAARCDYSRQTKIDAVLTEILDTPGISKNLFEVVSKIKGSYNLSQ